MFDLDLYSYTNIQSQSIYTSSLFTFKVTWFHGEGTILISDVELAPNGFLE